MYRDPQMKSVGNARQKPDCEDCVNLLSWIRSETSLFDDHRPVHDHPVAGERANVGVTPRLLGGPKIDLSLIHI